MSRSCFDSDMQQSEPGDTRVTDPDVRAAITFGAWIREARHVLGCSQAVFGRRVGLHQSTVSRLERGLLPALTFRKAIRLLAIVLDTLMPRPRTGR